MPKTNPIQPAPKTTRDALDRKSFVNSLRTLGLGPRTKSNGRVGAAVAGRKLGNAMKTRGGAA